MNHYPFHIGDFNNATRHLSRLERCIYRDCMDLYYDKESPLPADFERLARRLLVSAKDEVAALKYVLDDFFTLEEDGYHSARCDGEIAKYHGFIDKQAKAGKASARARRNRKADAEPALNGGYTNVEPTKNQEPRTKNHIKEIGDSKRTESPSSTTEIKSTRSKPKRPIDDSFTVTAEMIKWVEESNYGHIELLDQTERFIDHWKGKGEPRADWVASWRIWIRNADKYQKQDSARGNQRQQVADAIGGDSSIF